MILIDDVVTNLIDKLAEAYPKPARWQAFAAQVAEAAPDWITAADLQNLAKRIITSRDAKTFPNIPTLIMLVKAIPKPVGDTAGNPPSKRKIPTERIGGVDHKFRFGQEGVTAREAALQDAEKRAYSFLRDTEVSARAIAERWTVGLIDFAIREGREPDAREETRIIAKVRANDVDVRDFADVPNPRPRRRNDPAMQQVGKGIGEALRQLRGDMHDAAKRRLSRFLVTAGREFQPAPSEAHVGSASDD